MTGRMVHYSGRVQGVGFRATVAAMAKRHPVTGWVRNLPDGRVQMLVEGEGAAVDAFLQAVRDQWSGYSRDEQVEEQPATGMYRAFDIVR